MPDRFRFGVRCAALATATLPILLACGTGSPPAEGPAPPATDEWRFSTEEHIALWYHGLALARVGVEADAPVPFYRPDYHDMVAAARGAASGSTLLARDAAALGARMTSAGAADGLQFLPLYFDDWGQLRQSVDVWRQAGGDPNRVAAAAQPVVAFLSARFPNATQRNAVVEWVNALEAERTAFFSSWWAASRPAALAEATQALWQETRPRLTPFLRYTDASSGQVSLTPALGGEGRMDAGRGVVVAAIGGTPAEDARIVVGRIVHELAYGPAADAVRDAVAPARIREIGESVLVARAAVRGGAMVLERLAPELADDYTRYYLRVAGAPSSSSLARAYPLPEELLESLTTSIRLATSGI